MRSQDAEPMKEEENKYVTLPTGSTIFPLDEESDLWAGAVLLLGSAAEGDRSGAFKLLEKALAEHGPMWAAYVACEASHVLAAANELDSVAAIEESMGRLLESVVKHPFWPRYAAQRDEVTEDLKSIRYLQKMRAKGKRDQQARTEVDNKWAMHMAGCEAAVGELEAIAASMAGAVPRGLLEETEYVAACRNSSMRRRNMATAENVDAERKFVIEEFERDARTQLELNKLTDVLVCKNGDTGLREFTAAQEFGVTKDIDAKVVEGQLQAADAVIKRAAMNKMRTVVYTHNLVGNALRNIVRDEMANAKRRRVG